jgi:hypothetical protein
MRRTSSSPPALRVLLYAGGSVASAAGFHTAVTGARSIAGGQTTADPVLESELRFYGTFYAAYGLASGHGPPLS